MLSYLQKISRHIAMEKCLTSLDWYCRKPLLYHGVIPMPSEQQVLLQMAEGLHYIHSQVVNGFQRLIHRDVKPGNILISCDNPAVIKWADFGLSRAVVTGSKSFTWSQLKGTDRWLAPELIQQDVKTKVRGSQSCDVFALGCVFFFYFTQGIHPFGDGDKYLVQNNIKNANLVNRNSKKSPSSYSLSIMVF
jgi:serine/threonine protein kinase